LYVLSKKWLRSATLSLKNLKAKGENVDTLHSKRKGNLKLELSRFLKIAKTQK